MEMSLATVPRGSTHAFIMLTYLHNSNACQASEQMCLRTINTEVCASVCVREKKRQTRDTVCLWVCAYILCLSLQWIMQRYFLQPDWAHCQQEVFICVVIKHSAGYRTKINCSEQQHFLLWMGRRLDVNQRPKSAGKPVNECFVLMKA